MKTLRAEDPFAFAAAVRHSFTTRQVDAMLERHPPFQQFLDALPIDQRNALITDLLYLNRPPRFENWMQAHPENSTDAAGRPRDGRDPTNIPHLTPETYDQQTRQFETEIERAEDRIHKLRALLEKRKEHREHFLRQDRKRLQNHP